MLSERTIINSLILIGGMILGPYLIILTFEVNQLALLSFSGIVFLFAIFFVVKDRISAFPLLGAYFSGTLNFLPLGFTPSEIFSLTAIFYYFINYVALKRRPIDMGPRYFLFPMLVIAGILLIHDHSLKVMGGGGQEGSRPSLLILMSIVAYICGINIPSPSAAFLGRIPWWCFILTCLASAPFILTTCFPSIAPYVYYVSGNVNISAYLESVGINDASDVEENSALVNMGGCLQSVLVAYFAINTWWRPSRWIIAILSLVSLSATLSGGYRNAVLSFALLTFLGALCYSRWRVLIILPLLIIVPAVIIFIQNDHPNGIALPVSIQRSMSFLPGKWDADVVSSADASNDFRAEIKRVYKAEYLYKSPWIGNGFNFDPVEAEGLTAMSQTPGASDKNYYNIKAFLVSKNFHVGWISLYDAVGIIGGVAFVILNGTIIWLAGRLIFSRNTETNSALFPVKVWLFSALTTGAIGYITTFGNFSQTLVTICGTAIILVHIDRIDRKNALRNITLPQHASPAAVRCIEPFPISTAP